MSNMHLKSCLSRHLDHRCLGMITTCSSDVSLLEDQETCYSYEALPAFSMVAQARSSVNKAEHSDCHNFVRPENTIDAINRLMNLDPALDVLRGFQKKKQAPGTV